MPGPPPPSLECPAPLERSILGSVVRASGAGGQCKRGGVFGGGEGCPPGVNPRLDPGSLRRTTLGLAAGLNGLWDSTSRKRAGRGEARQGAREGSVLTYLGLLDLDEPDSSSAEPRTSGSLARQWSF